MAKTTYSEKLKDPRWQKKRIDILGRDNLTCQLCSDTTTELQVHHKSYKWGNEPWEYEDDNFITLCKHCHKVVESFKGKRLTPIIASKYYEDFLKCYVISTILKHPVHGMVLAIHYYHPETDEVLLVTMIEKKPFKNIESLFQHAEKLIT